MAELRKEIAKLGFDNIITKFNSGNVIFDASISQEEVLEKEKTEVDLKFPWTSDDGSYRILGRILPREIGTH